MEGDIGYLRYGGISLFFLRYFGIFLEKLRYYDIGNLVVHGICNFGLKTAVIDKIFLRYYDIEYPPMPPSIWTTSIFVLPHCHKYRRINIVQSVWVF